MNEATQQEPLTSNKLRRSTSPEELLASEPITLELKRLGATDKQLQMVHFSPANRARPFAEWAVTGDMPLATIRLLKPYCTLRWLYLEDPSPSRDRDDAWLAVAMLAAAPVFDVGLRAMAAQKARASNPRVKIDDGKTIKQVIVELALSRERQGETVAELWPHFYARLEALELSPEEIPHPTERRKSAYHYDYREKRRTISYGRFANVVGQARKMNQSR